MPVYSVRAPDGNTYDVRGPAGASREEVIREVIRRYPDAGTPVPRGSGPRPIQRPNELEQIPFIGRGLAGLADLQIGVAQTVHSGIQGVADTFGPRTTVGDWSRGISNRLQRQRSSTSRQEQQITAEEAQTAEDEGVLSEIGAAVRGFARSPGDYIASGVGSILPSAAAARVGGAPGAMGYGVVSGAGAVKGAIYDAVKTEAMRRGRSEAEAEALADDAQSYTGENWYNILIGGTLGAIGGRFGVERNVTQIAINRALGRMTAEQAEAAAARVATRNAATAAAEAATRRSVAGGIARGSVAEAIPEIAAGGQERFASNVALDNAGYDTDLFRGVAGAATTEGLIGGVLGGTTGGLEARSRNQIVGQLESQRAVLGAIAPEIETLIAEAADGGEQAKARLEQQLLEFGLDEDMAKNRANSYVQLELNERERKAAGAPQAAPTVDEGIDLGGMPPPPPPTGVTPPPPPTDVAPPPPPTDEEPSAQELSPLEMEVERFERLIDDDRYIAREMERVGENEDEVRERLRDQLEELKSQLPLRDEKLPMGERPGTQRTVTTINGVTTVNEGPTAPTTAVEEELVARDQQVSQDTQAAPSVSTQESVVPVTDEDAEYEDFFAGMEEQKAPTQQSEPVFAPDEEPVGTDEFLPGELFVEEDTQQDEAAAETVDEAEIIDSLIAEQQALFEAEPVKSTPRAKKAQQAIQQLQDAKEGLALELPLAEGLPQAAPEQVEAAQASLAQQAKTAATKQVERDAQAVEETQNMVRDLGPNYAMYEFRHLPDAPKGKFEIWVNRRDGRRMRRSVHKTLKAFQNAVDNLKGLTEEAGDIESEIKTSAGLNEDGYKSSRTAGHKAVQELTAEIERQSATGAKKLSNLQRTELLRMLENPVKRYDVGERAGQVRYSLDETGNPIPYTPAERRMDALFREVEKRTKAVRETQAKIDASGAQKGEKRITELRETLKTRNEKLLEAVKNITEPVRARMQEMIEDRENELFGAKQTAEQFAVEEKLGFADLAEMRETVETLRPPYDAYLKTEADIKAKKAEMKGKTPLEIEVATKDLNAKLRRLKPRYDEYLQARAFLDGQMKDLAEVRGERLRAEQDFEEARVFNSVIAPELQQMPMESTVIPADYGVAFGPEEIDALLGKAVADGVITKEGAEFTRWLISQNPAIAASLYLQLTDKTGSESGIGTYNVVDQAIKLIPQYLSKSPAIGVHEILHHTERMLPAKLRAAIRRLWERDFNEFRKQAEGDERAYMDALAKMHAATDAQTFAENKAIAAGLLSSGAVSRSLYRYFNPSEYWAEMGSEILAQRFEARNSTMAKIKQWYREMLEKLKSLFGKDSAAPVIRALDNILNGDGSFASDSMLFNRRGENLFNAPKIPSKTAKKFRESGEKISEGLRRAQLTQDVQQVAEDSFGTIKNRLANKDVIGYLNDVWTATDARTLGTFLTTMLTSSIVSWKKDQLPGLQAIVDGVEKMQALTRNVLTAAEKIAEDINAFRQKGGEELIATTMVTARINRVSLGKFATTAEGLQNDPVLIEIRKQLAKSAADPDKMARLKEDEKVRTREVRDAYMLWEKLAKQPGGQQLYVKMRDYHKTSYIAMRSALDKIIENFSDDVEKKNLLSMVRRMQEEAAVRADTKRFTDLPPDVFPQDYFPFLRFGRYYLKVAAYQGQSKQFYTFDTPSQRDAALRAVAKKLDVDPDSETGRRIFHKGDNIDVLQEEFGTDDEMMRRVFEELDKAQERGGGAIGPREISQMKDAIYQVYLMSTPERSLRRAFLKSDDVVGMSMDVLRTFSTRASSVANQLARAEYGGDIRDAIKAAYENIDPAKERDLDERRRLETIVREIGNRAQAELDPQAPTSVDTVANLIKRMAFLFFLTGPATAAVQFTSIPLRVVPNLGARYGYSATTKVWAKYMQLWSTVGSGDGKGQADVLSSKMIKTNPLLKRALQAGLRRGVLESLGQTLVNDSADTAGSSRGKAAQYATKLYGLMTYMFNSSENISKQAAYLMAFELEHNKLMADEKPTTAEEKKAIFDRAVSSALGTVGKTIGDYGSMERPSLMRGPIGSTLFLFKSFVLVQTSWFVGTLRRMLVPKALGANFTPQERWTAWKDMIGVHLMTYLLAGVPGLPLYSLVAAALKAFEDEEEERENRLRNPYTADSYDLWFRYEWLPSKFGEAEVFGRPLSAIMANGPVSEFTGMNIASRTGMDLKQMWWRDSIQGETPLGSLGYALLANIAPGGMASNFDKAYKEFADGDVKRGMEYLAPGFFRGLFSAERLATEGIETGSGKVVMSPQEFTQFNLAMQFLGFQPLAASKIQQMRVKVEGFDASTFKERTRLMGNYAKAVLEGADSETIREAAEDIVEFNETYPMAKFLISVEDLQRSLKTRERQRDVRGVTVTPKEEADMERIFGQIR